MDPIVPLQPHPRHARLRATGWQIIRHAGGLRATELRGLTWDHVDFDANMIRVRQRADRWNVIGPPKSEAGRRDIPMVPMLMNTLMEWKLACPNGDLDLVFPNGAGGVPNDEGFFGDLSGYSVFIREDFRAEISTQSDFANDLVALKVSRREQGIVSQAGRMVLYG